MSWVKFIVISLLFVGSGIALKLFANPFERGETLSSEKVKLRWGTIADYKAFKSSDDAAQAKMAYSIMTDKSLIGKSIKEVFGKPDGFYFLDRFPAYIIQEGKTKLKILGKSYLN